MSHSKSFFTRHPAVVPVLLGLATTVLSWVGVFAVFTYIAPILTQITGVSEHGVSWTLLLIGLGLTIDDTLLMVAAMCLGSAVLAWRLHKACD